MGFSLSRRLACEAAGTGVLVATVVGSGLMAQRLTADVAVQLLCNALPTAAILAVLIALLRPISGAHFNPVVSLVMAMRRALVWRDASLYVIVQSSGACMGTVLAHAMFEVPLWSASTHIRSGAAQWLAEGVASFGLVATILLAMAHGLRSLPVLVGTYIGAAYWFTASTSFANPAVTLARSLTDSFSGIRIEDVPGFVVAQLAGGLLAILAIAWLSKPVRRKSPEAQ
jgi:glycerol uptake facilitator-like aquaporin